ncbi:hypothetical protein MBH78_02535 [Oceanimonas sp. NS1]|nr:hypothetical protein [Oceanimonas sp. NS1]
MPELQALEPPVLQPNESCEQVMVTLLHQALTHWQHHEEGWLARPGIDWLVQLREGAALVHQILLMFGERVSLRVNSGWVDDLLWLQQQLSWLDRAQMLAHLTTDKGHYLRRLDCRKACSGCWANNSRGCRPRSGCANCCTAPAMAAWCWA